jgi:hypothetical protein
MNTTAMLRVFCDAVEQHKGAALAELFTEDGSIMMRFTARLPAVRKSPS